MVRVVLFSVSFYVFLCLEVQDRGKRIKCKMNTKTNEVRKGAHAKSIDVGLVESSQLQRRAIW